MGLQRQQMSARTTRPRRYRAKHGVPCDLCGALNVVLRRERSLFVYCSKSCTRQRARDLARGYIVKAPADLGVLYIAQVERHASCVTCRRDLGPLERRLDPLLPIPVHVSAIPSFVTPLDRCTYCDRAMSEAAVEAEKIAARPRVTLGAAEFIGPRVVVAS